MEPDTTRVRQVSFSELYLGHPSLGDRICEEPGSGIRVLAADSVLRDDLDQLKEICAQANARSPAIAEFKVLHDGVAYRAFMMQTLKGPVFVLRKIADKVETLSALGIPQAYIRYLTAKDLSGLLLVSGALKTGKTTTACAIVKERLTRYGGVAVTVEDPIELPLEGSHGAGICYQTLAPTDSGGFADTFRHIVRWGPKIVFVGEIRDRETAAEVLQASANGQLVISTISGDNIVKAIMKLQALTNDKVMSGGPQLLADGLLGVLHQRLGPGPKQKLETEFLFLREAATARANILHGEYEMLAKDIRQQAAMMITESATTHRRGSETCS